MKLIFWVFLFCLPSLLRADLIFVLQSREPFHSEVEETFKDSKNTYVLLTQENFKDQIDKYFRKVFKEIIFFNSISVETLRSFLEPYISSAKEPSKIVTHDEYALEIAAELREYFHLKGDSLKAVLPFRNKYNLRQCLTQSGICQPAYQLFPKHTQLETISLPFPYFIKPLCEARCRSIYKISSPEDFQKFQTIRNLEEDYLAEEAIDGVLYNCPFILENHAIKNMFFCEYAYPCFDFFEGKPLGALYLPEPKVPQILKDFCARALKLVTPLNNGVGHIEVFIKEGKCFCLEIAIRPPGGLFIDLIEAYEQINLEQIHYNLQMGNEIKMPKKLCDSTGFWLWYPKPKGSISKNFSDHIRVVPHTFQAYGSIELKYDGPQFLGDRCYEISVFTKENYSDMRHLFNSLKTLSPGK